MMKCTASFGYAGRDYDSLRSLVCFVLSILLRFSRTLGDSQWRYLNHRFRTLLHGSRTPNHRFGLVLSVLTPRGFSFAVCKKRYMLSHISLFGTPEGIRTPDLLVRSQTLYPTELPAHNFYHEHYYNTVSPVLSTYFIIIFCFLLKFKFVQQTESGKLHFFNLISCKNSFRITLGKV